MKTYVKFNVSTMTVSRQWCKAIKLQNLSLYNKQKFSLTISRLIYSCIVQQDYIFIHSLIFTMQRVWTCNTKLSSDVRIDILNMKSRNNFHSYNFKFHDILTIHLRIVCVNSFIIFFLVVQAGKIWKKRQQEFCLWKINRMRKILKYLNGDNHRDLI